MSINSKVKGARGEIEFARENGRIHHWCSGAFRSKQRMGSPDSPDILGMDGFAPEVKRVEKLRLYQAVLKAVADAGGKLVSFVAHRRNRQKWLVTVRLEDVDAFCEQWIANKRRAGYGADWKIGDPPIEKEAA